MYGPQVLCGLSMRGCENMHRMGRGSKKFQKNYIFTLYMTLMSKTSLFMLEPNSPLEAFQLKIISPL